MTCVVLFPVLPRLYPRRTERCAKRQPTRSVLSAILSASTVIKVKVLRQSSSRIDSVRIDRYRAQKLTCREFADIAPRQSRTTRLAAYDM